MAKKTTRKTKPKKTTTRKTTAKSTSRKGSARSPSSKKAASTKKRSSKKKSSATRKPATSKTKKQKKAPKKLPVARKTRVTKKTGKAAAASTKKKTSAAARPKKESPARTKASTATTSKKKTTKRTTRKTLSASKAKASLEGLVPDKDGYVLYMGRRVRMISTKNVVKKKVATTDDEQPVGNGRPEDKPVKTKLAKRDLDRFRDLLHIARAEKRGDLSAMEAEALRSGGGNLSTMPIHMADIGTDVYDQDFMLGMAAGERQVIREIDEALQRIENKTYGMCLMTGKPIPKARLNAKPWAKYTIEAARMIENGQFG